MKRRMELGAFSSPTSALCCVVMALMGGGCPSSTTETGGDSGSSGMQRGSGGSAGALVSGGGSGKIDGGGLGSGGTLGNGGDATMGSGGKAVVGMGGSGGSSAGHAGAGRPDAATTGQGDGGAGGKRDAGAAGDPGTGGRTIDAAVDTGGKDTGAVTTPTTVETLDLDNVWSSHPAAFSLVTRENKQFAAYYDASRQMTIAQRNLGETTWTKKKLDSILVACDSHNYVTMAVDQDGMLHVSGNMHGVKLVYYRATTAFDTSTLTASRMVDPQEETEVTYPQFFYDNDGELIFAYRSGSSGNGNYIFNRYSTANKSWTRLLSTPLIDGKSQNMSAYPVGPIKGPDGWFHLVWVWRDSPNAETNHDLSYAKSQDLVHWRNATGQDLTLPITPSSVGTNVDPVKVKQGMINNNTKIGFDAQQRVILSYHKNDAAGTQLFNARKEGDAWAIHKTSSWNTIWNFSGQGTLVFKIQVEPVVLQANGVLTQEWYHADNGGWGAFQLDPTTLASTGQISPPRPYPSVLDKAESTIKDMEVQWANDTGKGPDPTIKYLLRWETLPSNRDTCPGTTPPPSQLRAYGFRQP